MLGAYRLSNRLFYHPRRTMLALVGSILLALTSWAWAGYRIGETRGRGWRGAIISGACELSCPGDGGAVEGSSARPTWCRGYGSPAWCRAPETAALADAPAPEAPAPRCLRDTRAAGADDPKRAALVCACTGETPDRARKNECLSKVYGWKYDSAVEMATTCLALTGSIAWCDCLVWGMVEAKPEAAWDGTPADEDERFLDARAAECAKRGHAPPPPPEHEA